MKKLIYLFFVILLFSCERELDFEYHDVPLELVIESMMAENGIKVTLNYTTPMAAPFTDNRLTDAIVTCEDISSGELASLFPDKEGIYTSDLKGEYGHEYLLKVERENKTYVSRCKMREAPEILGLEFQWIKMPYDHVAVLQISFTDFPTADDCYWLKVYRNDEPYTWIITDDRSAVNGVINEVIMTTRKNLDEEDEKDILRDGDVVKVAINTISREMYDYLLAIENNSNGPSMFEGDFCLGYFLASGSSTGSIVFHPDDFYYFVSGVSIVLRNSLHFATKVES